MKNDSMACTALTMKSLEKRITRYNGRTCWWKAAGASLLLVLSLGVLALAQGGDDKPFVLAAPVGNVQVHAGASKSVPLDFRVGSDYHINSHTPHSPLLIPTALKLDPTTPVTVADVKYPTGKDETFPFSPDEKLNVYSGDFSIEAMLKVPANTAPGGYLVKGELRFQACDRSACYPPRTIPVQFQVTVVK
ncbi:MAG TPA: protein-disulfide reductase DsbD domain-containing protein [Bryocella sp.]|nr:protein-disulfide reductase DsbD domain-containing protein [Bryocella sp.]